MTGDFHHILCRKGLRRPEKAHHDFVEFLVAIYNMAVMDSMRGLDSEVPAMPYPLCNGNSITA